MNTKHWSVNICRCTFPRLITRPGICRHVLIRWEWALGRDLANVLPVSAGRRVPVHSTLKTSTDIRTEEWALQPRQKSDVPSGCFPGSKIQGVGRWASATTRFIAYASNFPFTFPIRCHFFAITGAGMLWGLTVKNEMTYIHDTNIYSNDKWITELSIWNQFMLSRHLMTSSRCTIPLLHIYELKEGKEMNSLIVCYEIRSVGVAFSTESAKNNRSRWNNSYRGNRFWMNIHIYSTKTNEELDTTRFIDVATRLVYEWDFRDEQ